MGDTGKAAAQLDSLKVWLETHPLAETVGRSERLADRARRASFWELTGKLAEMEKQPREALAAYQHLLQYRSNWETIAARFAILDKTSSLWQLAGGTAPAWDKWLRELTSTIAAPAQNWDNIERSFPRFALMDLTGRKWTDEDLKGRVTLINMWASWCGPCIVELPYIQRIQNAVKDREDIQVITLNVDENPGLIAPFLKQRGLTSLTVLPAMDFVEGTLKVNGFPRTWIVGRDGVARREQAGFTGEPAKWVERVMQSLK